MEGSRYELVVYYGKQILIRTPISLTACIQIRCRKLDLQYTYLHKYRYKPVPVVYSQHRDWSHW